MFIITSFLKSICYKGVIIPDDEYTLEDRTRMVIKNFNDIKCKEVDRNIKLLKSKILLFLSNKYSGFDIKLSPIHKKDNWGDQEYVYIAVGIFYHNNNQNPFCFDRLILKVEGDTINIENKQKVGRYINKKNILS